MTDPLPVERQSVQLADVLAKAGHAAELATASEADNVRGPKSVAITLTQLWSAARFGDSPEPVMLARVVEAMRASWLEGGMSLSQSAAYRLIETMIRFHRWQQIGHELRLTAAADDFPRVGNDPPLSPLSFDHGEVSKAKEKGDGELRVFFKGSMAQVAEILNSADPPRREAVAELIADVLAALRDRTTSDVVPRRIAEMLLPNWSSPGPEGITGRDALGQALDYLATAERFVGGPRQALIACLAHRGFDYRVHYARDRPPRS